MAGAARVIIVEDDASVAEMYRLGLEYCGFEVTTVGSGDELMGSLDGIRPDVIVLDYQLPGRNGAEVLQMIRNDGRVRAAPVLMLSNFPPAYEGAVDRVFKFGAMAWLEKAKTPPDLLALKLTEALDRTSPAAGNGASPRHATACTPGPIRPPDQLALTGEDLTARLGQPCAGSQPIIRA